MDPQVGGSFIPKQPLTSVPSRGGGFGLLFLIALLIFIASLVAAGAVFLYQQYLNQSIASKSNSLQLAEGAYDPSVIQDLGRIDTRINQAEVLLKNHVAASAIFSYLSTQTLQNVYFTSFSYELEPNGGGKISLAGQGDTFSTVALQSDQFGSSKYLKNVVFSGIAVAQGGGIGFAVAADIDPSLISYTNALGTSAAVPNQPGNASSTRATSTPQ